MSTRRGGVVSVSIWVATRHGDGYRRPAELIAACDRALDDAKNLGRNRTHSDALRAGE